ncbi:hypothetical protein [Methylobacterium persicinum]|uniref:Uncharacterized protein n=1 Tax=Methylobacterium persicinum TaxID=374426 RepID=A0ABU0HIV8_9HYPH|nr:hypothetical protein [Methylobacterium persicinum]MDQ0441763.1 hypothetical protein [Methylobacterium persicinum]GJE39815.1 hypothetical protein KHHGKMAE_3901 [Methylobacterium persicinum]
MRLRSLTILAGLALLPASVPAMAQGSRTAPAHEAGSRGRTFVGQGFRGQGVRGYGYGYPAVAYGGGFAQPFIQGDYIGEPYTTVPRPDRLVPSPWSYGTYGVPTVSGIAAPPTEQPTLTVIHPQGGRRGGIRAGASSEEAMGDTRVVNVSVPRR